MSMKPKAGRGRSFEDVLKTVAFEGTTALLRVLDLERLEVLTGGRLIAGGTRAGREATAGLVGLEALLGFVFFATLGGLGASSLLPYSKVLAMVLVLLIFLPLGLRKSWASSIHFSMDLVRLIPVEAGLFMIFFAIVFQQLLGLSRQSHYLYPILIYSDSDCSHHFQFYTTFTAFQTLPLPKQQVALIPFLLLLPIKIQISRNSPLSQIIDDFRSQDTSGSSERGFSNCATLFMKAKINSKGRNQIGMTKRTLPIIKFSGTQPWCLESQDLVLLSPSSQQCLRGICTPGPYGTVPPPTSTILLQMLISGLTG